MSKKNISNDKITLSSFSPSTKSKFYIYSIIGIIIFFVNFQIGESKQILVGHLGEFIQNILMPIMPYLIILFTLLAVIDVFKNSKTNTRDTTAKVFSVIKIIGFIFSIMAVFGLAPDFQWMKGFSFVLERVAAPQVVYVPLTAALFLY